MESEKQRINLFQVNTDFSPGMKILEKYIRVISIGLLSLIVVAGFFIGVMFYALETQRVQKEQEHKNLVSQIQSLLSKESMIKETKFRLNAISTILKAQQSYVPFLDTAMSIAQMPELTAFSLGEQNAVSLTIRTSSFDAIAGIASKVFALVDQKKIFVPVIDGLKVEADGATQINITYKVIVR